MIHRDPWPFAVVGCIIGIVIGCLGARAIFPCPPAPIPTVMISREATGAISISTDSGPAVTLGAAFICCGVGVDSCCAGAAKANQEEDHRP